ncbi:MAG: hypothetical protein AUJ98_08040 [Bacteroidetes bacterium CG2_30_33_31]|nr:MAG: hypothetical protein AUJ98_08040 [Bacteroidetes bacterium CG2_30_33_31]
MIDVSIILPIYNQQSHIEIICENYIQRLVEENINYEILFIVNGSHDESFEKCQNMQQKYEGIKAFNISESGWGRSVKYGIDKAEGKLICYTNSARTNIKDIITCIKYSNIDFKTVVKSNRIIRENFLRRLGSVIYNFENRYFFNTAIWDVNATPKVFPKDIIKSFNILSFNDLIDAELMARCRKLNITTIEVPIYMTERISGKSTTNIMSALKMYTGLISLKRKLDHE